MSSNLRRRVPWIAAGVVLAVGLSVPPANAAPPANDEISNARLITQIPARVPVDSTNATTNPSTDTGGYPCMGGNSVWYRLRPTTTVTARFLLSYYDGTNFDAMIGLFRGPANDLRTVACNDDNGVGSGLQARLYAGANYYIAVSTCCDIDAGYGGTGYLRVYVPRDLALYAPVVTASAGDVSGRAFFTGTVKCTTPGGYFSVSINVSQRVGELVARGDGYTDGRCPTTKQQWSVTIDSQTAAAFRPGNATVTVNRYANDGFQEVNSSTSHVMTLAEVFAKSST
jgi:hypothetical protein